MSNKIKNVNENNLLTFASCLKTYIPTKRIDICGTVNPGKGGITLMPTTAGIPFTITTEDCTDTLIIGPKDIYCVNNGGFAQPMFINQKSGGHVTIGNNILQVTDHVTINGELQVKNSDAFRVTSDGKQLRTHSIELKEGLTLNKPPLSGNSRVQYIDFAKYEDGDGDGKARLSYTYKDANGNNVDQFELSSKLKAPQLRIYNTHAGGNSAHYYTLQTGQGLKVTYSNSASGDSGTALSVVKTYSNGSRANQTDIIQLQCNEEPLIYAQRNTNLSGSISLKEWEIGGNKYSYWNFNVDTRIAAQLYAQGTLKIGYGESYGSNTALLTIYNGSTTACSITNSGNITKIASASNSTDVMNKLDVATMIKNCFQLDVSSSVLNIVLPTVV